MIGKIIKLICEIVIFAGVLWRFSGDWQFSLSQQFDAATFILQIIIVLLSSFALAFAVVELIREIRQRRREKEENRIGPDL